MIIGLAVGCDGIRTSSIAVSDIGEAIEIVVNVICLSNEIIVTVSIFVDDLANGIVSIVHPLIALSINSHSI
ncbi:MULTISPECIES: hypothetical protein [Pseudanabaena]|uniref:Uncharacterized protein n=1 Tax=Pseudanabaena catenata USMAC16 TaxID=1855837 RepID=A0A9X4RIP6_9CYAN|nr:MULTISPECIES: hypothetical protein [Pseudanabaena]MDG3496288.1 hypothetical protein [Pseudanabaena catenata USMAC16]